MTHDPTHNQSHDEAVMGTALRDALADDVRGVPLLGDVDAALAAAPAPRSHPRRRWLVPAVAAAAVVGVVGVGLTVFDGAGDGSAPSATGGSADVASGGAAGLATIDPTAVPEGMRLIGSGRVVVTIPDTWTKDDTHCGEPQSDTWSVQRSWGVDSCLPPRTDHSQVVVAPGDTSDHPWSEQEFVTTEVDGVAIERTEVECTSGEHLSSPGGDATMCAAALAVPSEGILVDVRAPEQAEVDRLLDSVGLLPQQWVTVPERIGSWPLSDMDRPVRVMVGRAEALGLEIERTEGRDVPFGVATEPVAGTPVRVGSTLVVRAPIR